MLRPLQALLAYLSSDQLGFGFLWLPLNSPIWSGFAPQAMCCSTTSARSRKRPRPQRFPFIVLIPSFHVVFQDYLFMDVWLCFASSPWFVSPCFSNQNLSCRLIVPSRHLSVSVFARLCQGLRCERLFPKVLVTPNAPPRPCHDAVG